jgi:hypothetical protein
MYLSLELCVKYLHKPTIPIKKGFMAEVAMTGGKLHIQSYGIPHGNILNEDDLKKLIYMSLNGDYTEAKKLWRVLQRKQ